MSIVTIGVNCNCPWLLWTRARDILTANMKRDNPELADVPQRELFLQVVTNSIPLGRAQTPEEIGNLAAFFASGKARMITGTVVAVDGGQSL